MRTVLTALVLALAAAAAPAGAAVTTIDMGMPAGAGAGYAGPVLTGGKTVWAVRGGDGAVAVRSAGADGTPSDLLRLPAVPTESGYVQIAASDTHVLLQRVGYGCGGESPCKDAPVGLDEGWGGPLGGPLKKVFGCSGTRGCLGEGIGMGSCPPVTFAVGGARAVAANPCYSSVRVLDLATGTESPVQSGYSAAVAGPFQAIVTNWTAAQVVVRNLDTGAETYRVDVPGEFASVLVQADGTIVVTTRAPGPSVFWASPAAPSLHPVSLPDGARAVALAGDRIYSVTGSGTSSEQRLFVSDLAGDLLLSDRAGPGGPVAWDATRLAWAVQPCQAAFVVLKPLGERAPDPFTDHSSCPVPAVSRNTVRPDRARRATIKLACPAAERLGCRGVSAVDLLADGVSMAVGAARLYAIPAGAVDAIPIKAPSKRSAGRLRVTLTVPNRFGSGSGKARVRKTYLTLRAAR